MATTQPTRERYQRHQRSGRPTPTKRSASQRLQQSDRLKRQCDHGNTDPAIRENVRLGSRAYPRVPSRSNSWTQSHPTSARCGQISRSFLYQPLHARTNVCTRVCVIDSFMTAPPSRTDNPPASVAPADAPKAALSTESRIYRHIQDDAPGLNVGPGRLASPRWVNAAALPFPVTSGTSPASWSGETQRDREIRRARRGSRAIARAGTGSPFARVHRTRRLPLP